MICPSFFKNYNMYALKSKIVYNVICYLKKLLFILKI